MWAASKKKDFLQISLHTIEEINSLQNNKILDQSKWKAFADDKLNIAKIVISIFDLVENIVGKGENAG